MNFQVAPTADWLGLQDLEPISQVESDGALIIRVRGIAEVTGCLRDCEILKHVSSAIHRYGTEPQEFRDTTLGGKPVILKIDRQRYRCMFCKKLFYQPIRSLDGKRHMTARMIEHIVKQCVLTTNMNVARNLGIDEGTVRAVFRDWYALQQETVRFSTPEILGIDEISLTQRMPRCVLTNVGERRLFDILPNRRKDDLRPYFSGMPDRYRVKVVVADMWRPYHDIAREFFPDARTVVDRFHVQRMANNGLDIVRKRVARFRTRDQRIALKDVRFLLFKRADDLSLEEADRVAEWLRFSPDLRRAYRIKEAFSAAYSEPNRRRAEKAFDRCIQKIPPELRLSFSELTTAFGNWRPQILNFFDLGGVTNAYTESVNGLIRLLQRNGRGYSFEVMRARLLYDKEARSRRTSVKPRPRFDPGVREFLTGLPDEACDRDAAGLEYGPSIDALLQILERDENDTISVKKEI